MTVKDVLQRAGELEFQVVHFESKLRAGETVSDTEVSELLREAKKILSQLADILQYGSAEEIDIMEAQIKIISSFATEHEK